MSWVSEVATSCIVHTMPQKPAEDKELIDKFHQLVDQKPLESVASFVKYLFDTTLIWVIVTSEVFLCMGRAVTETIAAEDCDRDKTLKEWSKASCYYAWSSFVLPIIFMAGYKIAECREFYTDIEKPVTEDLARRMLTSLKADVKQKEREIKSLEKEKKVLADTEVALQSQLAELQQLVQEIGGANGGAILATQISSLQERIAVLEDTERNLRQHEKELEEECSKLRSAVEKLEAEKTEIEAKLKASADSKAERLIQLVKRLRSIAKDEPITLTDRELKRLEL